MNKSYFAIAGLFMMLGASFGANAESRSYEAEGIYRGTAENGLTGLYYTASPYTVSTGLAVGAYGIVQPVAGSGNNIITPVNATLGLGSRIEFSAMTRLVSLPGVAATGDTEAYAKYQFRSLGETMPAMAIAVGGILPTATDPAAADVNTIGGKLIVMMGGDAQLSESAITGIYFNISANFFDPGAATQDNFIGTNFGLMIPISDNQKMQGFVDIRNITGKVTPTLNYADGTTTLVGLRYAARFMKITGAVEFGGTGSAKVIGGLSLEI